jgi:hypothetical protein
MEWREENFCMWVMIEISNLRGTPRQGHMCEETTEVMEASFYRGEGIYWK